jgi:hypothetical protein
MPSPVDDEIEAIRSVLSALEPLQTEVRRSVLEYVIKRLGVGLQVANTPVSSSALLPSLETTKADTGAPAHIKAFKELKVPRSANEMSALVAYFLAELASEDKRKQTVNTADIKTYFKIADFPLPQQIKMTLPNAKNAGYFDLAGDGEYRLNAIGHNLVVHSMPRGGAIAKRPKKPHKPK